MPPPRRRTRRRRSGGKGGSRRSAGGAAARRAAARRAKQKNDARRAEIRDQYRANQNRGSGANVATGGSSTGRESGIMASQNKNKIKSLEQSVGSLDRRIENALKSGNTDLAKDLRSRLNKFTTQLGDERAKKIDGGVARTDSGSIIKTSSGRPVLTNRGLAAFNQTKDMDFLDPTRKLQNEYPEQFAKMYPITNQLNKGLPTTRIARKIGQGLFGMEPKPIGYTDDDMPGIRYPLDVDFGAGEGEPFFGGRSRDPDFDSYPYIAPVEPVTITDMEFDPNRQFSESDLVLPNMAPFIDKETRNEVFAQDVDNLPANNFAALDEEFQRESAEFEKRKAEEPTFQEKFPYQVAGPDALPSFFNLFGQNDSDEVVQLPPSDSAEFNVAADNIANRLSGPGYNLSPEIITNLYQQGFLDPNINYFPDSGMSTNPLVDEALQSYYQSLQQ